MKERLDVDFHKSWPIRAKINLFFPSSSEISIFPSSLKKTSIVFKSGDGGTQILTMI
jgi:hypothetical protein